MKIFNSGSYYHLSYEFIKPCPNILISIHCHPKIINRLEERVDLFNKNITLMIDNGAFSQWNKSVEIISNKEWIEFCGTFYEKYKKFFKEIYFISLDKIPGRVGVTPTLSEIQDSAEITYNNYIEAINSNILTSLPVFHQHENFKFLKQFLKISDYICISPANDQSNKSREKWLNTTFQITNKIKTHGLAVTGQYLLQKFPFYSVDSTTYAVSEKFAEMNIFKFDKFKRIKLKNNNLNKIDLNIIKYQNIFSMQDGKQEIIKQSILNVSELEKYITLLWKERGICWT